MVVSRDHVDFLRGSGKRHASMSITIKSVARGQPQPVVPVDIQIVEFEIALKPLAQTHHMLEAVQGRAIPIYITLVVVGIERVAVLPQRKDAAGGIAVDTVAAEPVDLHHAAVVAVDTVLCCDPHHVVAVLKNREHTHVVQPLGQPYVADLIGGSRHWSTLCC